LLLRTGTRELTRTEAGVLTTLSDGTRTITELADAEAVAQPTMSRLVDRLAGRGFVSRQRESQDGRFVRVAITPKGATSLEATTDHVRALLRHALRDLPESDLVALATAGDVIERIIEKLQREEPPQ